MLLTIGLSLIVSGLLGIVRSPGLSGWSLTGILSLISVVIGYICVIIYERKTQKILEKVTKEKKDEDHSQLD